MFPFVVFSTFHCPIVASSTHCDIFLHNSFVSLRFGNFGFSQQKIGKNWKLEHTPVAIHLPKNKFVHLKADAFLASVPFASFSPFFNIQHINLFALRSTFPPAYCSLPMWQRDFDCHSASRFDTSPVLRAY